MANPILNIAEQTAIIIPAGYFLPFHNSIPKHQDEGSGVLNGTMTYDHIGNLATLQRNYRKHQLTSITPSNVSEMVDDLT